MERNELVALLNKNELHNCSILPIYIKQASQFVKKIESLDRPGDIVKYVLFYWEKEHKDQIADYHSNDLLSAADIIIDNIFKINIYDITTLSNLKVGREYNTYTISALANRFDYPKGMYYLKDENKVVIKSTIEGRYKDRWINKNESIKYYFQDEANPSSAHSGKYSHRPNNVLYESFISKKPLGVYLFYRFDKGTDYVYAGIFEVSNVIENGLALELVRKK